MTLIDSSAGFEFLRKSGYPRAKERVCSLLLTGEAGFSCSTFFDLLVGAREDKIRYLREIPTLRADRHFDTIRDNGDARLQVIQLAPD